MKVYKRTFILYSQNEDDSDETAAAIHDAVGNILAYGDVGPGLFISTAWGEAETANDPDWDDEYAGTLLLDEESAS